MIISQRRVSVGFVVDREETHGVGGGEVDAEASGSRTEQEDEDVRPAGREGRRRGYEKAKNNYYYLSLCIKSIQM